MCVHRSSALPGLSERTGAARLSPFDEAARPRTRSPPEHLCLPASCVLPACCAVQGKTETPEGLRTAMAHITKTLGQLLGQEGHTGKPATAAPAAAEPAAEPAAVAAAEPAAAPAAAEPAAAPAAAAEPAAAPAAAAEPAVAAAPAAAVEATPMEQ